jgi:hypothetical protein
MLFKEIILFILRMIQNSQLQNAKWLFLKACGTYSYYYALKGYVKLKLSRYAMQSPKGRRVIALTHSWPRHQMGVSGQRHSAATLYPVEKITVTHCIGGWVGPRASLNTEAREKIFYLCRGSNHVRPVCSQTLYCVTHDSLYLSWHVSNL